MAYGKPMSKAATDNMAIAQARRRERESVSKRIGVDRACYDLARHFLADVVVEEARSDKQIKDDLTSLAESIQQAVENWFLENLSFPLLGPTH